MGWEELGVKKKEQRTDRDFSFRDAIVGKIEIRMCVHISDYGGIYDHIWDNDHRKTAVITDMPSSISRQCDHVFRACVQGNICLCSLVSHVIKPNVEYISSPLDFKFMLDCIRKFKPDPDFFFLDFILGIKITKIIFKVAQDLRLIQPEFQKFPGSNWLLHKSSGVLGLYINTILA